MAKDYKTVLSNAKDEFVEKRSRFIGYCKPVTCEQEAVDFINEKRSEHWNATHNVYAYSLREGNIKRYSDDGEPSGTAGMPCLDVIVKNEIYDVCVVVTRYFGGVLLGTGGLVRAYSHGAKIALDAAKIVMMQNCLVCSARCTYNRYGKVNPIYCHSLTKSLQMQLRVRFRRFLMRKNIMPLSYKVFFMTKLFMLSTSKAKK